jgi:hypothetical protein
VAEDDQITTMEWLKGLSNTASAILLVGTLMGHLYQYSISEKEVKLVRFISNAHFESITALA